MGRLNQEPLRVHRAPRIGLRQKLRLMLPNIWDDLCLVPQRAWEALQQYYVSMLNSSMPTLTTDVLARHVETSDWENAPIRYVALHPYESALAVLTSRDVALVYQMPKRAPPVQLKNAKQRHISCAAFRPESLLGTNADLAVSGCGGICLWLECFGNPHLVWLNYEKEDFVTDLQWMPEGRRLVSATLGFKSRIQIWQPDEGQLLTQLEMPQPSSHLWLMRYPKGVAEMIATTRLRIGTHSVENDLLLWEFQLTNGQALQTACWVGCGRFLLHVLRGCHKVYFSVWQAHPSVCCTLKLAIDLASFSCNNRRHSLGPPQALALDPKQVYVAFTFKRNPVVLLCLLIVTRPSNELTLTPVDLIRFPGEDPEVFATCLAFGNMGRGMLRDPKRLLAIGWSSGHLQTVKLLANSPIEAVLKHDLDHVRHPPKLMMIDMN